MQALLAWDPALRQGMAAAAVTSLWKLVELARPPAQAAESPPAPGGEVEAKEGEAEEVAKGPPRPTRNPRVNNDHRGQMLRILRPPDGRFWAGEAGDA